MNQKNIKNHGISFKSAARVFFDYDRIEYYDEKHSDDEERFDTIGDLSAGNVGLKAIEGDMVTGFKVINKLIVTEESVDTSDINIWMYVIIAIVSVGVIIIVCVVIVKSKNRK